MLGERYAIGSPKCDLSLCQASIVRSELLPNATLTTPRSHNKVPLYAVVVVCVVGVLLVLFATLAAVYVIRRSREEAIQREKEQYVAMNAASCE